jgi:branched-chain amino acid transport system permease protein
VLREVSLALEAGIGLGALYALVALGYTLILAASGVFNLVQGTIAVAGTMVMLGLWQILGWPILGVAAITLAGGAVIGIVTYFVSVFPLTRRRDVTSLTEGALVTTFALWLMLGSILQVTFGDETLPVNNYVSQTGFKIGGVPIEPIYIVMLGATLFIVLVFEVVLRRTGVGLVLRATVEDNEGARLAGIPVTKVVLVAFAVGGALAGIAGMLMAPITFASPFPSADLSFYGFAGMAIGGFGSFSGAIVGGLLVGVLTNVPAIWVNPSFMSLIVYAAMLLILAIRPAGLFGSPGAFGSARVREI